MYAKSPGTYWQLLAMRQFFYGIKLLQCASHFILQLEHRWHHGTNDVIRRNQNGLRGAEL
jgi:hypothetical protein